MAKSKINDILIRIFCLLASTALWIFIITSTDTVQKNTLPNVPVQIQNQDALQAKGLILSPGQNPTAKVTLEGPPKQVFSVTNEAVSVGVDLSSRNLKVGENQVQATMIFVPAGTRYTGKPNVTLMVDEYIQKPLEIKKDMLHYKGAEHFYLAEPTFDINYVTVSGAKTNVDQVAALKPKDEGTGINKPLRKMVKIIPVDESDKPVSGVKLSQEYVEVSVVPQPVKTVEVKTPYEGGNGAIKLKSITPVPASVRIAGSEAVLRNIDELSAKPLPLSKVEAGEHNHSVVLVVPPGVTLLSPEGVAMEPTITVKTVAEAISTKSFQRPVTISGAPTAGKVTSPPQNVSVSISGASEALAALTEDQVIVSADVTGLGPGNHEVKVKVTVPSGFTIISTTPETLSVVIQ